MSKRIFISVILLGLALRIFGAVNDTIVFNGVRYQVTKEDPVSQTYEVSAVYYDSASITLPDYVQYKGRSYNVTNVILWLHPRNCALAHYSKIDMGNATHITYIPQLLSALIAVDTLILPPHLRQFPANFYTTDTTRWLNRQMDEKHLLPGIHRIYTTGTQNGMVLSLSNCTSLIEADLSSYPSTNIAQKNDQFCSNPFLQRLVLPNTFTHFWHNAFSLDIRLTDLVVPDSLEWVAEYMSEELAMDTLRLGRKVSYIRSAFATGWYKLRHIDVDPANPYFMDGDGVLFTKNRTFLHHYPFTRDGSVYYIPAQTDSIGGFAFANTWPFGEDEAVQGEEYAGSWEYVQRIRHLADAAPLKKIVCHPGLKYIGHTFLYCDATFAGSGIRDIANFDETRIKIIPSYCFYTSAIDSTSLPRGLTTIGDYAFAYAYNLHTIGNMSQLNHLQTIGQGAFAGAWNLKEMELLPCEQLLDIPQEMCYNDSSLLHVSLPRNVRSIGQAAFKNCCSLRQIISPSLTPVPIDSSVFEGVNKRACVLKVPAKSLSLYKKTDVWKEFFHMDTTGIYYIDAYPSDRSAGTVTGAGAYLQGEYATLTALPNSGYQFVLWSDGNPYSTRVMHVSQDEELCAVFKAVEPVLYQLTVLPNDSSMGKVSGSGLYEEGDTVTVTASPSPGYSLQSWSFTNSMDESIIYVMPRHDVTIHANFRQNTEALEPVESPASVQKVIINGILYILRNGKYYSATGNACSPVPPGGE